MLKQLERRDPEGRPECQLLPVAQVTRPYGAGEPAAAGEISIVSTIITIYQFSY